MSFNNICRSILATLFLATLLNGSEIDDINVTGSAAVKVNIHNSDKLYKALGTGGKLLFTKKKLGKDNLSAGAGIIATQPIVTDKEIVPAISYSKSNNQGEAVGTFYLSQLYLKYEKNDWSAKAFIQTIDTPLLGSGYSLFMPNSYEGITYNKSELFGIQKIHGGYLTKMTGSAVPDQTELDAKYSIGSSGLLFLGGHKENLGLTGYLYYAPDLNTYQEESYIALYAEKDDLKVGETAVRANIIHTSYKSDADFFLVGGDAAMAPFIDGFNKAEVSVSIVGTGNKGVAYHFGNVPEYTKMEEFNLQNISAAIGALKGEVGFQYTGEQAVDISAALGLFFGKDEAGEYSDNTVKNAVVLDIKGTHKYSKKINIEGLFEYQHLKATSGNSVDSTAIVALSAEYIF